MSTILTFPNYNYDNQIRHISVSLNDNLLAAYDRAIDTGDDFILRHIIESIDEEIVDEICATFDIGDEDRENIFFSEEFAPVFAYIHDTIREYDSN